MLATGGRLRLTLMRAGLLVLTAASLLAGAHAAGAASSAAAADPNTLGKGAADAVSVVRWISPGTYQLDVQNTSGIGYINQFTWVPPGNLTVTAVTSTEGGHCSLSGGATLPLHWMLPPTRVQRPPSLLFTAVTVRFAGGTHVNWLMYPMPLVF